MKLADGGDSTSEGGKESKMTPGTGSGVTG